MQQPWSEEEWLRMGRVTQQPMRLGREFNPMKIGFQPQQPHPVQQFNPFKFTFDVASGPQPQYEEMDLLDMLPECRGPEHYFAGPQMMGSSHHSHQSHHFQSEEPSPALDEATLSLLDSLELKFAPSSTSDEMSTQVVKEVLGPRQFHQPCAPRLPCQEQGRHQPRNINHTNLKSCKPAAARVSPVGNSPDKGLTTEQLRVLRNKAVQKRYRQRKKSEALRQNNIFGTTKANLALAEEQAPAHHVATVDKLLLLRQLNKERDGEIQRLREMLRKVKESEKGVHVPSKPVLVCADQPACVDDFCDQDLECVVPGKQAMDVVGDACVTQMTLQVDFDERLRAVVEQRFVDLTSPRLSKLTMKA